MALSGPEWAGIASGGLGGCFILAAFLPQVYKTYQTKNTVGINRLMFFLHLVVGVCFFYGAVCLVASGFSGTDGKESKIVNGMIFTVLNFITSMGCLYTLLLKNQNAQEAKKMGISELEHYHQVCVPYVQERMVNNRKFKKDENLEK